MSLMVKLAPKAVTAFPSQRMIFCWKWHFFPIHCVIVEPILILARLKACKKCFKLSAYLLQRSVEIGGGADFFPQKSAVFSFF